MRAAALLLAIALPMERVLWYVSDLPTGVEVLLTLLMQYCDTTGTVGSACEAGVGCG